MPGLLPGAAGAPSPSEVPSSDPAPPARFGGVAADGAALGGDRTATPEEQAAYDRFVAAAMTIMFDEKVLPSLLRVLQGDGDPVQGLAQAAANVVLRVEGAADEQGVAVPGDVKFHAGSEIVEQLADLGREAGIRDFSDDEVETAFLRGLDMYREVKQRAGELSREAAQQDLQTLVAADQAGRLDEVLPGAREAARRLPDPAGASEVAPAEGGDNRQQRRKARRGKRRRKGR